MNFIKNIIPLVICLFISTPSLSQTQQVSEVELGGFWYGGETVTVTVDDKTVNITIGDVSSGCNICNATNQIANSLAASEINSIMTVSSTPGTDGNSRASKLITLTGNDFDKSLFFTQI